MVAERTDPNVIVLIFDALRPDFLSVYNGSVQSNAFEDIARQGTTFEQAFAAGPWTPISHAAMYTGQYPSETGVVGQTDLPKNLPVLAEWLSQRGYDTYGIAGPSRMGREFGFDRGFDDFFEPHSDFPGHTNPEYFSTIVRNSDLRRPLVREFVRSAFRGSDKQTAFKFDLLKQKLVRDQSGPTFALANFTTAHTPYDPPRPYKERATPSLERSRWQFLETLFGPSESLNDEDVRLRRIKNAQRSDGIARFLADPDYLTEGEMDVLRAWYGASIKYLDTRLEAFIERLRSWDEFENTIFVLTADHGEHFGEHGLLAHSHMVFEECTRVPLIVTGPGVPEDERRDDLVSLVDLFDTICDLIGIEAPDETSGSSMFSGTKRDRVYSEDGILDEDRAAHLKYIEDEQQEQELKLGRKALRTDDHLYVLRSDGSERLFDRTDESELENPDSELLDEYRSDIMTTLNEEFKSVTPDRPLSEEVKQNLRELGYRE